MAAGDFAAQVKLGRPGYELSIGGTTTAAMPPPFQLTADNWETDVKILNGQHKTRIFRRSDQQFTIKLFNASNAVRDAVISMRRITDSHLSFVFANQWSVYSDRILADTTTGFALPSTADVLLDQAYYSLTPTGTAIIQNVTVSTAYGVLGIPGTTTAVSSYDRATGRVVLNTTTAVGTAFFGQWTYDGRLMKFARAPQITQSKSFQTLRGWDITMILRDV